MSMYGNFAVWAKTDSQPVWADEDESQLLARVGKNARMRVLRRVAAHYIVRLPDMREGYVRVDAVAAAAGSSPASPLLSRAPLSDAVSGEFRPASMTERWWARFIDSLIMGAAMIALVVLLLKGQPSAFTIGLVWMSFWAVGLLYEWIGTACGGTIGKQVAKVQVIDAKTGRAPGPAKAAVRHAVYCMLGLLSIIPAFFNGGRAVHDMAAGTRVMRFR